MKYVKKTATSPARWVRMSSDVKKRKKQPWAVFYTPLGRMVTKPSTKRKFGMSEEEWAASNTQFKHMRIK